MGPLVSPWWVWVPLFVVGLCVGSFLNVVIWRLPQREPVVAGRSHCPSCRHVIPWYDNIPLLSFMLLKGKCRFCGSRISWIYPTVELATGLLLLMLLSRFGFTGQALAYAILGAALLVVSVIDARTMEIPDAVTLPGIPCGLALSFIFPTLQGASTRWGGLITGLLGVLAGFGLMLGLALIGRQLFRRKLKTLGEEEAMGAGDIKLMAMVGAFLGVPKVLLVIFLLAPLVGSVVGLILKVKFGKDLIPYGPFLALGTLVAIFFANPLIAWYQGLF